ncbi:MAG TPA: PQQ-binding-like beta-propeller repeat protein [Pyrinomonadaceae bacterium]|nr:PQQ-binding-like beta-propeller repeat protein [Pyrinomonadaceae bacterium]
MTSGFFSQAQGLKKIAFVLLLCAIFFSGNASAAEANWSAKLDGEVRFYQMTELGVLVAGTEKSLYAVSGETGEILWRRKNARLDETDVAPVPGTDLLLLSFEKDERTRLEAVDLFTGDRLWQSDKVKGGVMQMAVDTDQNLLAAVFVRDAKDRARSGFKRRAVVHVFELSSGDERWDYKIESEVEMMPVRWSEDRNSETAYTLDNYHPPFFLDGRLYLFYEGVASLDARTGKERQRERFRVNEEGLALTEADPVFDEQFIYSSGRGHVRAVSRESGKEVWEAKDLGLTPEMLLTANGVLYVRTGGQFTRLEDGEAVARGSYGVSAIDARTGKTLWRYKGADKGITNIALPDAGTVVVADADDLLFIDAETGKRRAKVSHKIERAAFVLVNERGELVVGGRNEIAAFDARGDKESIWRARYTPPGRGFLRTVAGIAARAASLYFRYGGTVTTVFRGVQLARTASSLASLRWSGLASRVATPNLTTFATERARDYVSQRFSSYGVASRLRGLATTATTRPRVSMPSVPRIPRPSVNSEDVGERLLDRLDPASQLDKLARFFWRRERLAALRGTRMYFYTDLKGVGNGLAGVNIHNGQTDVRVRMSDPDERFITDETTRQLFVSKGDRLFAYGLGGG